MYKCVWGLAPEAFTDMVVLSNPRTLKVVEKDFTSQYGKRAFSYAGPKLWNSLPRQVREEKDLEQFKKRLKSLLMTDADSLYRQLNMR